MVETRENSPSKRKLSLLDFSKVASLIGMGATLLTACQEAGTEPRADVPPNTQPPETATENSPVIEATPTAETLPASLESNRAALQQMGYTLQQGERGWDLISPKGQTVLTAVDSLTLTLYGANNELSVIPEQNFGITETKGLGMQRLLTVTEQGQVTQTFLERGGYWASLPEEYNNFDELENCPQVPIEYLWDGLAQFEALRMKPFPEGTIAPEGYAYTIWKGNSVYWVLLNHVVDGLFDMSANSRSTNYPRRYPTCYRSITPKGVEVVIAVEENLMPDGKRSFFQHYVYGMAWIKKEGIRYASQLWNLNHSVLNAYNEAPPSGWEAVTMRPKIFIEPHVDNFPPEQIGVDITGEQAPAMELYSLPQNDPTIIFSRVVEMARGQQAEMTTTQAFLAWATEEELAESQFMGLNTGWKGPVPDFFYNK